MSEIEYFGQEETEEQDTRLTEWKNEPLVSDLKKDYQEATGHHETHISKVDTWLDNLYVRGGALPPKIKGRSRIVPKLIRKQAEWRYAALSESFLSNENLFQTDPVTFEDKDAAVQNGLVLNNQFNTKIDKVCFIDEYVRTAVDEGTVVVRVGWEFEEEEVIVPNFVPIAVTDPYLIQMITQGSMMVMQNPEEAQKQLPDELLETIEVSMQMGRPVELIEQGTKIEMHTIKNQPTVDVCAYKNCIIDPTCKGIIEKAGFTIYPFETSKSDLEKEGIYHNLDQIQIETNSIQNTPEVDNGEDSSYFQFSDEPRKKFVAYEYWGYWDIDGTGKTKPIVATWVGDTMIRMEESPFQDGGLPFILVQYLPKRKEVYGEPDGELLEDNQRISGAVTRGMIDIMGRSATGQVGIRKDALDVTNRRKYDAGMDYSFNAHIDPKAAFHTHVYPEIPASAMNMLQLQNMEAEALTGVKAYSGGISGDALGKVATGVRGALDAASKRELGILRRLAKGIVEIGRKVMAMNAEFLSDEEVVRITNEEFVTVKRDDLQGEIDVKLQISTAETDNAKAEELSFMLQTMGNTMPPEMSYIVLEDIARLRKMPELAKKIKDFEPQPDPFQQEMQRLQLEEMQAKIDKLKSETMENLAEAELDSATAGLKKSQKDTEDLKFVEQESGVTQERDIEKGQAQADGNKELEVVKAALNPKGGNSTNSG